LLTRAPAPDGSPQAQTTAARSESSRSVVRHLAIFALAFALPILAFVGFVLWQYASAERARLEAQATETARTVAFAIDQELSGLRAALDVLSLSQRLQDDDLAGFYEQARDVERLQGFVPVLRDLSGQQLVNIRRPFGTPLPSVTLSVDADVLSTKTAQISDVFLGAVAGEPLFALVVPVIRRGSGEISYTLSLSLPVERIRKIIAEERIPQEWTVAVVDRAGVILARNNRHSEFVGKRATDDLLANTAGTAGSWRGQTIDGQPVFGAYHRSRLSGWRVAVGVRSADLDTSLRRSLWLFAGLGLGLLVLAVLLATMFGRRITGPLHDLTDRAAALGRGEAVAPLHSRLTEADRVGEVLSDAGARLAAKQRDRDRAIAALQEETSGLDALNKAGKALASELALEPLAERLESAAASLTHAEFSAFVDRATAFAATNPSRSKSAFAAIPPETLERVRQHDGVLRVDAIAAGEVRSLLGFALRSRAGDLLGSVLLGHSSPGHFGDRDERLMAGLAGQAAIAIDNALLFDAAQTEIVERKRVEEALAAARRQAEAEAAERSAILGQLAEGVVVTDRDGRITFVNDAAIRLHGVSRLDVAPDAYSETYHLYTEDGRPHPVDDLPLTRAVRDAETILDARWRIRRPDGTEVLAIGNARPVFSADGARIGAVLTLRDDTAREGAERALRQINETLEQRVAARTAELETARDDLAAINRNLEDLVAERTGELLESNEEIQRYAYIVSHDLRAPLVNVMGFTSELELVRDDIRAALAGRPEAERIDRDIEESLSFIKAAINKMDGLINAILKLSREGRRAFKPEPLEMAALLRGLADAQRHQAVEANAEVLVGPAPEITHDRLAIEQIFGNLIDNALKYLAPGRPGRIEIAGEVVGTRVRYTVRDNGRGISPHDHARIFELFRRSGAQDKPGEGIGLAHVKALVRSLGGRIEVRSTLGEGATFIVTLPRTASADAQRSAD
jgi:PAS domain S-box-containing protein